MNDEDRAEEGAAGWEAPPATFPADPGEPGAPPLPDGGVSEALIRLLRLSPLTDLHRYAGSPSRVREFVCFWGDAFLRIVVYLALVGLLLTIAVKVLAPLPDVPVLPWLL